MVFVPDADQAMVQSLGAEITDANQTLEPEVIQALISGKKLTTRTRSVIMREDKPQPEKAKKEAVRPPRPIVKPTPRTRAVEAPKEEAPVAPAPPTVIIPEFIQAAEDEERAAKEAPPAPVTADTVSGAALGGVTHLASLGPSRWVGVPLLLEPLR